MSLDEIAEFHNKRNNLFAKRDGSPLQLDRETINTMAAELPRMEAAAATTALITYRAAKPYKGFWWPDYVRHYATAIAQRDKTDSRWGAAAACSPEDHEQRKDQDALEDQRKEIEAYSRIPMEFRERCRTRYSDMGWPIDDNNRAWRMIVLSAFAGHDVEQFRIHDNPLSPRAKARKHADEMDRQTIIEGLRIELESMRKEVEFLRSISD
jgi:hypothetical protein